MVRKAEHHLHRAEEPEQQGADQYAVDGPDAEGVANENEAKQKQEDV